jgi:DHA2 family multidrug resistance protein-like MFS transporter
MQGTARLTGQSMGALAMGMLLTHASAAASPRLGLAVGAVFAVVAALVSAMEVPVHGERQIQSRG